MNIYTTNSLFDGFKSSSVSVLYAILPLFIGAIIDITFTQHLGTQFCLIKETDYVCTIHGIEIKQWQRELGRLILQLGLIMCAFVLLQNYNSALMTPMYTSLFGSIGLVLFFASQQDVFSDFRRLCNGIVFRAKYN